MSKTRVAPWLVVLLMSTAAIPFLKADTDNLPPGYSIQLISSGVAAERISQMAFKPGDFTHVYWVNAPQAEIIRSDYDPVTGQLSNAATVASRPEGEWMFGLGFHSTNLYVALRYGPGDAGISRFMDLDGNGTYELRHEFVHSIPTGQHDINQLQIKGNSLYVGIGAATRTGDPAQENPYTMTIARIVDLNQVVTDTNQIGSDGRGPIHYLPDTIEWTNSDGTDGQLRYFASGFRNPFGIGFDATGQLWVSVNGNSDPGFLSDDFLYREVRPGDEAEFPPPEFGFAKHITGNPITNFVNMGLSPSPTGFDFITDGPDAGKVLLARAGATDFPERGRDLLLIDSNTGAWRQIYQFSTNSASQSLMTDVVRDPFGRFLVADFMLNNIWLVTPPLPDPEMKASLTNETLQLTWPLTGIEYGLEETVDPSDAGSWAPSPAAIQITTNGILAEISTTNAAQFFRLKN